MCACGIRVRAGGCTRAARNTENIVREKEPPNLAVILQLVVEKECEGKMVKAH